MINIKYIYLLAFLFLNFTSSYACQHYSGYTDNNDGSITDPRTQIVWQRCYSGQSWDGTTCQGQVKGYSWFQAMRLAKNNVSLGKSDWRLPTRKELQSIIDPDCTRDKNIVQPIISNQLVQIDPDATWSQHPNWKATYQIWTSTSMATDDEINNKIYSKYYASPYHAYYFDDRKGFDFDFKGDSSSHRVKLVRGGEITASIVFGTVISQQATLKAEDDFRSGMKAANEAFEKQRKQADLQSQAKYKPQAGHGGVNGVYRFEDGKAVQVKCNDGAKETITRMETGGWWFSGRKYDAEYVAAEAVCR